MDAVEGNTEEQEIAPRLIKRYTNRKLYDTQESRYVTLQDVAEFVRAGQDVKVVDNRSKEDLTNITLAQIIYEEEKNGEWDSRKASLLSFIQEGRDKLMTSLPKFRLRKDEREVLADHAKTLAILLESLSQLESNATELRKEIGELGQTLSRLQEKYATEDHAE